MKLLEKYSKWTVTNSSFFMRASKRRRNLWQTSLWSCQFYVMMSLEWHWRSFLPFSFICCLFVCISSVGGGFRKNLSVFYFSIFCFLYFLFDVFVFLLLFLLMYFVLVFVSIYVFCFCSAVFCSVCFSVFVPVCCSIFVVFFCFFFLLYLFCFVLFCCFTVLHTKNKKGKILQLLFSNVLIEFKHFYMFFIGFLTCINCERCTIF